MRPVTLDLNGFAAFREPARVDFADADFFALVGPTGSGKSTVIDAMTFALYGSVPRWGRKGMVSLALAPTVGRGTVKLVFDVAGQRYVVARELRRTATGVSQRAASLERLADPRGLAGPGDPTEVLAGGLAEVTEAVERLLGLSYEDFCQCVVLPQGQFANFLHAKASDRQEILLRLLGAEHYQQMMRLANQRASAAGQRAASFAEALTGLADATPAAEDGARAAEQALAGLSEQVTAALPRLRDAAVEVATARGELSRLGAEQAALAAIRVPDEAAGLDERLAAARREAQRAGAAAQAAEAADRTARAGLAGAPDRAPLELTRRHRTERAQQAALVPGLGIARDEADRAVAAADQAVTVAAAALEGLRERRDSAAQAARDAAQRAGDLAAEQAVLARVRVPGGIGELDGRRAAAVTARAEAAGRLELAEQAEAAARAARAAGPPVAALEQALGRLRDLDVLAGGLAAARAAMARAAADQGVAEAAVRAAEADVEEQRGRADAARRVHVAADLRPHLTAGQDCPVCAQPVTVLPPPLDAAALDGARAGLAAAEGAVRRAAEARRAADGAAERAGAGLDERGAQRDRHRSALRAMMNGPLGAAGLTALAGFLAGPAPGGDGAARGRSDAALSGNGGGRGGSDPAPGGSSAGPDGSGASPDSGPDGSGAEPDGPGPAVAEVTGRLEARRRAEAEAEAAAGVVSDARGRLRALDRDLTAADADTTRARTDLRAARDALVPLGAPAADEASLAAAWAGLASWAAEQAAGRASGLSQARPAAEAAEAAAGRARDAFGQAEKELDRLRAEATAAARAEQEARTRLTGLTARLADLDRLLDGAPDEASISRQLAGRDALERAAADTDRDLLRTRRERDQADAAAAGAERVAADARARLSAARDPVAGLGAPALDAAGLLDGWTALASWAARAAADRDAGLAAARQRAGAAEAATASLAGKLSASLAGAGIDLAPAAVADGAAAAVAGALAEARAAVRRAAERRAEAAGLTARRDAAAGEQQVARMVGDLLRSDRFPRWLVTAAIDALVTDASATLAGLSGGQFDLTHEDGEFYVIDHADADSRRSVRTLSGGETFQASLALALALSAQMASLAAAGAARLDSIFLDEGFGTLDPETLEVVSATLETLAHGQRMVGVVTHVAALAERVPVRFRVSRDARTSTVTREDLGPE